MQYDIYAYASETPPDARKQLHEYVVLWLAEAGESPDDLRQFVAGNTLALARRLTDNVKPRAFVEAREQLIIEIEADRGETPLPEVAGTTEPAAVYSLFRTATEEFALNAYGMQFYQRARAIRERQEQPALLARAVWHLRELLRDRVLRRLLA